MVSARYNSARSTLDPRSCRVPFFFQTREEIGTLMYPVNRGDTLVRFFILVHGIILTLKMLQMMSEVFAIHYKWNQKCFLAFYDHSHYYAGVNLVQQTTK